MKTYVKENVVIGIPFNNKKKLEDYVLNMACWREWSPWMCMEGDAKVDCSQEKDGRFQHMHWQGKIVGEGTNTVTKIREDGADYDLKFIKPFKSQALVTINFSPEENGQATRMEWTMAGSLPFFLFFMKKFFEVAIAKDYQRGLRRLKFLVETGRVPAQLVFSDTPQEIAGFDFCGKEYHGVPHTQLSRVMGEGFTEIEKTFSELKAKTSSLSRTGALCFYPKVNFVKSLFDFTIGFSFTGGSLEEIRAQGLTVKSIPTPIPTHKAIKVTLTGDYVFLEDAWTGIMMHARALKFKGLKKVPPYEKYVKMGDNPKQFVTEVYYPIK